MSPIEPGKESEKHALEFPTRTSSADPPINYTADGLETFVSAALGAAALGHGTQIFESGGVVEGARLNEQC